MRLTPGQSVLLAIAFTFVSLTGTPAIAQVTAQRNIAYGPSPRQVLDFFPAPASKPTPLAVYIHGGGFVAGNKSISPQIIKQFHAKGIGVAAIHYRFVDGDKVIFPVPQQDGARAIQFLRSKAEEWNIDSRRVACFGGSAGAGISMWIGFHDEMANPESEDPVERQSTRIQAVGTFGGQGTYDPIEIKELIGGRAWEHPSIFKVYGIKTTDEALHPTPELQELYQECSAIHHLTADDPPLFMIYNEPDGPLPDDARPGQGIHHPNFGRQLKAKMDELGIVNQLIYEPGGLRPEWYPQMIEFFQVAFEKTDRSQSLNGDCQCR